MEIVVHIREKRAYDRLKDIILWVKLWILVSWKEGLSGEAVLVP